MSTPWRKQEFSDARGTWRVGDLHDYAQEYKKLQPISVRELAPNNLDSEEQHTSDPDMDAYMKRAWKSDIETPIIVVSYPDGLWIADGTHRTWKARELGRKTITGWILDWEEILDIPHGDVSPESASSPY